MLVGHDCETCTNGWIDCDATWVQIPMVPRNVILVGVHIGATWLIWWISLSTSGDAGCHNCYCSNFMFEIDKHKDLCFIVVSFFNCFVNERQIRSFVVEVHSVFETSVFWLWNFFCWVLNIITLDGSQWSSLKAKSEIVVFSCVRHVGPLATSVMWVTLSCSDTDSQCTSDQQCEQFHLSVEILHCYLAQSKIVSSNC